MAEREYVLGTHEEEIERLGLQHRVWRQHVRDAWRRAGIERGHCVIDVGCGPGDATLELAEVVGAEGRVVAIDRSRRFLDRLEARAGAMDLRQIEAHERDFATDDLPRLLVDTAWCRWILAFVPDPRALLARVAAVLRPGGCVVIHEYYDYRSWRLLPPCAELEEFVAIVMSSWRADGGEPDIGAMLPGWLTELGLEIHSARPLIAIASPGEPMWLWPEAFLRVGLQRLVNLEHIGQTCAEATLAAFDDAKRTPGVRMCTPGVIEIIARTPARP
jgi:SAM-dependent methyltransferase